MYDKFSRADILHTGITDYLLDLPLVFKIVNTTIN